MIRIKANGTIQPVLESDSSGPLSSTRSNFLPQDLTLEVDLSSAEKFFDFPCKVSLIKHFKLDLRNMTLHRGCKADDVKKAAKNFEKIFNHYFKSIKKKLECPPPERGSCEISITARVSIVDSNGSPPSRYLRNVAGAILDFGYESLNFYCGYDNRPGEYTLGQFQGTSTNYPIPRSVLLPAILVDATTRNGDEATRGVGAIPLLEGNGSGIDSIRVYRETVADDTATTIHESGHSLGAGLTYDADGSMHHTRETSSILYQDPSFEMSLLNIPNEQDQRNIIDSITTHARNDFENYFDIIKSLAWPRTTNGIERVTKALLLNLNRLAKICNLVWCCRAPGATGGGATGGGTTGGGPYAGGRTGGIPLWGGVTGGAPSSGGTTGGSPMGGGATGGGAPSGGTTGGSPMGGGATGGGAPSGGITGGSPMGGEATGGRYSGGAFGGGLPKPGGFSGGSFGGGAGACGGGGCGSGLGCDHDSEGGCSLPLPAGGGGLENIPTDDPCNPPGYPDTWISAENYAYLTMVEQWNKEKRDKGAAAPCWNEFVRIRGASQFQNNRRGPSIL